MPSVIALLPDLEERLTREAAREGLPLNDYALKILGEHVSQTEKARKEKNSFLQSWIEEDADPQEGYDDEFFRLLDEDRLSDRKLFPPEMKGISW
ncbi:MAG TPA: hypothetical protein PLD20_15485 [Blastocatellia bacterium]|nr:hypothetical protein [Blastocatellia bacterium]HMV86299.1 hypothetical protein [Blastocatellia bacterium]HMX30380.1 hypothetical protein [Blastocatellia bacterium]HMY73905.1 hypothetical protein [Blastocatellia bacterium]HMZ19338.1 hypothetical protein [Blastocatellia bacterium]